MNRADGYRLKDCDPFYEIIPHIMPKRYDATNYIDLDLDMEAIQGYVNKCREKGIKMMHMSVMIAAYLRLVSQNPQFKPFCLQQTDLCAEPLLCFLHYPEIRRRNEETVSKIYFNLTIPSSR